MPICGSSWFVIFLFGCQYKRFTSKKKIENPYTWVCLYVIFNMYFIDLIHLLQKKRNHKIYYYSLLLILGLFMIFHILEFTGNGHALFNYANSNIDFERVKCGSTIVSLATFGSRIFNIQSTVNSLISQTFPGLDLIVVNVALSSRTGNISMEAVYVFLQKNFDKCLWSEYSHGSILCSEKLLFLFGDDLGPATKILGTIKMLPDIDESSCIISVDDDVVYSRDLVQVLVSNAPRHGVLGLSCEEKPFALSFVHIFFPNFLWWNTVDSHHSWRFPFDNIVECKGWLHGWQGILYQKHFFGGDVFSMDTSMPDGCFFADDVRLSGYLWAKGIKRYVYPHFSSIGCEKCGHKEKNASDALSLIADTMQLKQWPCVKYFGWN